MSPMGPGTSRLGNGGATWEWGSRLATLLEAAAVVTAVSAWPTHLSSRLANKGSQCKLNLPRGVEKLAGRGRPSHDLVNHQAAARNPIRSTYCQELVF